MSDPIREAFVAKYGEDYFARWEFVAKQSFADFTEGWHAGRADLLAEQKAAEPVAWAHAGEGRYDTVHQKAKALWIAAGIPKHVEHYTIPLYAHPAQPERVAQLEAALRRMLDGYCSLVNSGDCGKWDPENDGCVKGARALLEGK